MISKLIRTVKLNRSFIVYLIFALVPLITITIIVIHMTTNILTTNSTELVTYQSNRVAETLEYETETILDVYYNALTDSELRSLCNKFNNGTNMEYTSWLLNTNLKTHMFYNPHISLCLFIGKDHHNYTLAQRYSAEGYGNIDLSDQEYMNSLFDTMEDQSSIVFFSHNLVSKKKDATPVFYMGMPITSSSKRTTYGFLIFGIQKSYFQSAFFISDYDKEQDVPELLQLTHFILIDEEQNIIYAKDPSMNGKTLSDYTKTHNLTDKDYVLSEYPIAHTDWKLLSYCQRNVAFKSVTTGKRLIYLLVVLFAISLGYISSVIISHQNKKIKLIADGIQHYNGNETDYNIPLFANENLNVIITQFNLMADRVSHLTNNLIQEKKRTQMEMDLRRRAEIKALESQINPHFLYNTLDTIRWMAVAKNEMGISNMLETLGSLLRYSVTNIDSPVLVHAEIVWIKKYLFLQQKRFQSLFIYEIITDPGVEDMVIYKMLLQPLIENSIIHGFSNITEGGIITIKILSQGDNLSITIADNGIGIPEEKLHHLRRLTENPDTAYSEDIGFFNTVGRLHAYYKNNYQFHIESKNGTTIHILIPKHP